jgi:RNA polymerase sigma-70 factor (ECF subfamily)
VADLSDDELIDAARQGDRAALEELLRAHQDRIHALCRRLTGNDTDALDATQESMIAVVRGLPRFDGRSAFSTWVYRVTTNACLDELRRRSRRPVVARLDDRDRRPAVAEAADPGPDPADTVADRLALDAALGDLTPEYRAAVVLRDLCQLDYAEIAEVLQIPAGTVRSRIARGRASLAATLASGNQTVAPTRPSDRP